MTEYSYDENSLEFDDTNKIKLTNLNWVGFPHSEGYGYFDERVKARIYTLILLNLYLLIYSFHF